VAGKGDARSSAELAVKHDSWSKVCGQAARRLRPKVRRWRWIMREGEGQPLRLLVDLDGASLRWLDEQIRSAEHPLIDVMPSVFVGRGSGQRPTFSPSGGLRLQIETVGRVLFAKA